MKYCDCGTRMSKANTGKECSSCTRTRIDAEISRDPRLRQAYLARKLVGTFCRPEEFPSAQDYARVLDQRLCELTWAMGNTPPDLQGVWS